MEIKVIIALIYFVLIIGGITMVYPFLIMVSGSFKGPVDINNYSVIPRYFFNKKVLFRKYLESKYNESTVQYNMNARQNEFRLAGVFAKDKDAGNLQSIRRFLVSRWEIVTGDGARL